MLISLPKITIVAIGKIKNSALAEISLDYERRLSYNISLEIREVKDKGIKEESDNLLQIVKKLNSYTIALSEEGKKYTSYEFAKKLSTINTNIAFVIGGPEGLGEEVKMCANEVMSLSPLTFTHEIARILLLEQLYRTYCIINNIKYHK